MIKMEFTQEIKDFLADPNFMVLGLVRTDGAPQMTMVWYMYDPETDRFTISTTRDRYKYQHARRDERATFVIWEKGNPYTYIQVQAEVVEITDQGAHELIDDLSEHYTGKRPYSADPNHEQDRINISFKPLSYTQMGFEFGARL